MPENCHELRQQMVADRQQMVEDLTKFSAALSNMEEALTKLQTEIRTTKATPPLTSKFWLVDIPVGALSLIH